MKLTSDHNKPLVTAVIAAGGVGSRLGHAGGKQLLPLAGKSVLSWSIDAIAQAHHVSALIIAVDPARVSEFEKTVRGEVSTTKPLLFVAGSTTRQKSISAALAHLTPEQEQGIVLVHDGARPLVSFEEVDRAIEKLIASSHTHHAHLGAQSDESLLDGLIFGQPSVDTIKRVNEQGEILETLKRSELACVQTPQIFWGKTLINAYELAEISGYEGTDDASLVERLEKNVKIFESSRTNIKITHEEDLALAEFLLMKQSHEESS